MRHIDKTLKQVTTALNATAVAMGSDVEFILPLRQTDYIAQILAVHSRWERVFAVSVTDDYSLKCLEMVDGYADGRLRAATVLHFDGKPILGELLRSEHSRFLLVCAVAFQMWSKTLTDKQHQALAKGIGVLEFDVEEEP